MAAMDAYSYDTITLDYEEYVMKKMLPPLDPSDDPNVKQDVPYVKSDPRHRIIVCQHWLLGLCQVGNDCTYLHRFDKTKMPQCKHGKGCKIKNCPLKHGDSDVYECFFYKQGFCLHGPMCTRRHVVKRPEECPTEAIFDASYNTTSGGFTAGGAAKRPRTNQPNENYKVTLCTNWLQTGHCTFDDGCHFAHGEEEIHDGFQGASPDNTIESEIYDPTRFRMDAPLKMPFTQQDKVSYFILQSPDLRSLLILRRRGRWAVPYWIRDELNNAFNNSKHVILLFSVKALRGIYGVGRMTGEALPPVIGGFISREFPVAWLRSVRIALRTIAQMKVALSGVFIGKITSDCKVDNRVGLDLLYMSYRKPEWDWSLEYDKAVYTPSQEAYMRESKILMDTLHPDQLFSDEWIAKVGIPPASGDRFRGGNTFSNYQDRRGYNTQQDNGTSNFYNGDAPGFVFCSITPVVQEMLGRGMLALPSDMSAIVIDPSSPLYLLDMDKKLLFGVFQADSPLTENIDPTAFSSWFPPAASTKGSPLPYQLRFRVYVQSNPISLYDPEYITYMGKVHLGGELRLRETKILTNLFATRAGVYQGSIVNAMGGRGFVANTPFERVNPSVYKPPFKFTETVYLAINADPNDIKRRVLGHNASNVLQIIDEVGATKFQVRIRLRGLGSGFIEGQGQLELQEPLQLSVSAESEQLLKAVVEKVKTLVTISKIELEMQ